MMSTSKYWKSTSKYWKRKNARDFLTLRVELRGDDKTCSVATKKMDMKMLALLSRDLVAAERYYHKSCYKLYTKGEVPASSVAGAEQSQCEYGAYQEAEKQSYDELFLYIKNELIFEP